MRLTSLTINGFKSFGNRATVQFAPGVTAIVGPNGSGKSNVIDALRWATGGGRASEFRAGEKTELIFHGADGKKSQSYAEVEVELGHDTKRIHITRNLYRDGQSKLRLGGKNARFLDLEEELAGSGLGRNGLALIGQGEVSQVLMADPAKLLGYVAEAAGVGKFAARREQTQARLLTARDHLSRIEDVMREQQQRLDALQLEAGEAERATLLGRAVLQLRYSLSSRRVSGLTSELDTLKQQQDALRTAVEAGRDELTAARERWQKARVELATLEEAYRQALTETEARRGDLRVAQERLKNTQARRQALHEENQRATVEIERLTATEAPQPPQDDESELLESLEAASAQRNACQQQLAATENELQARSAQLEAARRDLHDAQAAVAEYQRRKAELEQSLEAVRTRLNDLKPNAGPNLDHQEARVRELRAQLTTQSQQAEAFREQLADLQQQHAHAVADEQATERHAARSRNTFETRRGYAQGPRQALTSGIAGVIGSVADLVRVPRPYEIAVGSALGRRAENVVVDDAATAQHVLAHLKQAGGWATLLPLDLIEARTPRLDPALAQAAGVIGLASDLIEFEPRYAGIFHQLLGSTLLIERMDQAVALARQFHQRPRMVTLEGDLLESYGAMSGGRRQSNTGLLGLAAEVDDAEEALTRARSRASELTRQLQTAQKTFRDLQATMQSQTEQLRQLESALARQREEQAGKRSRMEELSSRYTELEARLMALVEPEAPKGREPVELEAEVREAQERVGRLRQTSAEASERHAEARQKLALYRERRAGFQAAKRRYDDEQARLALLQAHQRSLKVALEEAAQEERQAQEAVDAAQAAVPRDLASKQTAFVEAGKQTTQAEEALSGLTQLQAERGRAHEELQLTLARREAALE
ncbi:MAG TPA: chromosome segregation SMC family protein, partial [Trueperaceae bacterium]